MKQAYLFLANGFEEIEAITPIDALRRSGIELTTVSIHSEKKVTGAHNLPVEADKLFTECDFSDADILILPGGLPGADNLNEHEGLKELLTSFNSRNKLIAAICAAPIVLGGLGIIKHRTVTCYPGFESKLGGAKYTASALEIDKNIITAKGPGAAVYFSLAIVTKLCGEEKAKEVASQMVLAGTY